MMARDDGAGGAASTLPGRSISRSLLLPEQPARVVREATRAYADDEDAEAPPAPWNARGGDGFRAFPDPTSPTRATGSGGLLSALGAH